MAINDYKLSYSGAKIDELLTKVNNMPEDLSGLKYQIVTELPTENIDTSTIYLVETSSHDYNEWIYVNNTWEMLGNTAVDLTNYATKEYVQQNGGKINSISVNGVAQAIDENKNVNIEVPDPDLSAYATKIELANKAPMYTYGTTDIGAGVEMEGEEGSLYFVIE